VHQRLRDEHGLKVSVSSFRRYIWRELPEDNLRNIATHRALRSPRGRKARSTTATWARGWARSSGGPGGVAFVIVLACSRYMFVRPVLSMDQRTWTACHVEAFAFFGGAPRRLVSDNLKTGVISRTSTTRC